MGDTIAEAVPDTDKSGFPTSRRFVDEGRLHLDRLIGRPRIKWYGRGFEAWRCAVRPSSTKRVQELIEIEASVYRGLPSRCRPDRPSKPIPWWMIP